MVYLMSNRSSVTYETVAQTTTNSATTLGQFRTVNPATLSDVPFPGFTTDFTTMKVLNSEANNGFRLVTQYEKIVGPPRTFSATYKSFIIEGLVQDTKNLGEFTAGAGVSLRAGKEFGNDLALETARVLFWSPVPQFPTVGTVFQGLPQPGIDDAIVPALTAWDNMRKLYPTGRWQDGIDLKTLDKDTTTNSTMALLRLRPGRRSPLFRISATTHLYVLEGTVTMIVPGAGQFTLPANHYAYVPAGVVLSLSNIKAYDGPVPSP